MQTLQHWLWNELFTLTPFLLLLLIAVAFKLRKIHDVSEFHPFDVAHTMPLRGILALAIVAHHMQNNFPTLHRNVFNCVGGPGVAIFFFISGYGLMKSYMRKGDGYLQGFLQKRFGRILPLLLCLSAVNIALRMWINQDTLWYILSGFPQQYTLNFSWFMYTISYFYIAFYFVARRIHSGRALVFGVTGAVLFFIFIMFISPFNALWYHTVISGVFGLAVAHYEPQIQRWILKHKVGLFVVLFAVWTIVRVFIHVSRATDSALIHMFLATPILNEANIIPFLILLVVYTVGMTQNKVLYFMGQISMEIYLFHGLYTQIAIWMGITNVWIAALFVYTLSISSAALLWKLQQRHHAQTVKAA